MADPLASFKPTMARLLNRSLVAPSMRVYFDLSGSAVSRPAGAAPTPAPSVATNGAGNLNGTYFYKVAYYDSANGHESVAVTSSSQAASNQQLRVTFNDTAPTGITHRRVYRNVAGLTTVFYRVDGGGNGIAVATGTFDDNLADSSLTSGLGIYDDTRAAPPSLTAVHRHAARVFGFSGSNLYWSEDSDPEWWPPLNATQISDKDGYDITALRSIGDDLAIFKRVGVHILSYEDDPLPASLGGNGWSKPAIYHRGCLNPHSVVVANGVAFVMDDEGVYAYFGNRDMAVIDSSIKAVIGSRDMAMLDWVSAVATRDRVRWFFARQGDGATDAAPFLRWALVLDLESMQGKEGPRWWLERYDTPIRHAGNFRFGVASTATPELLDGSGVMDDDGRVFMLDWMTSDGVPLHLTAQGTVTSSTGTPVVVTATGTYSGTKFSNYNLVGLYVVFVDQYGVKSTPARITAVGSNEFTLESGAAAPNNGDTFYIGSIPTVYDLPMMTMGAPYADKAITKLRLAYRPSPVEIALNVRVDRDRAGYQYLGATVDEGRWETTEDSTPIVIPVGGNLQAGGVGVVEAPVGSEAFNVCQFRIGSDAPNQAWRVYGIETDQPEAR